MKRKKLPSSPQPEFGFSATAFNLFAEKGSDGERIARERDEKEQARQTAAAAQAPIFDVSKNNSQ